MRDPMFGSEFSRNLDRFAPQDTNPYASSFGPVPDFDASKIDNDMVNSTGTTTIGLTTTDGVIIATDMRASLGGRFVSNKDVQKVEQIHPRAALTLVGSVGGAQALIRALRAEANLYQSRRGEEMSMQALSTLAGHMCRGLPTTPILGGVDDEGHHVYSIDPAGGVMKDDYTVTGSGLTVAYGTLERLYEPGLSNEEAIGVAAAGVKAAVERDTGSGNGVYIAEITQEGVDIHGHKDFDEVL
ncbi:proteasome subunit beta [Haladaptatus sp. YSMS36]|uniref:proteasome subunit beta n=1 Tax=Haladaptatus sp. YSMS36 TaxID=3033384 RepID=UPI0034E96BD7